MYCDIRGLEHFIVKKFVIGCAADGFYPGRAITNRVPVTPVPLPLDDELPFKAIRQAAAMRYDATDIPHFVVEWGAGGRVFFEHLRSQFLTDQPNIRDMSETWDLPGPEVCPQSVPTYSEEAETMMQPMDDQTTAQVFSRTLEDEGEAGAVPKGGVDASFEPRCSSVFSLRSRDPSERVVIGQSDVHRIIPAHTGTDCTIKNTFQDSMEPVSQS